MEELPSTVQVGPFTYKIERDLNTDGDRAWGAIHHMTSTIGFAEACPSWRLPITFIHELIHAVESAYGFDLDENDTTRLANGLAQGLQSAGFLPKELKLEGGK
ncbi:hypothetical protein LCGC14_0444920 [marine sediment metagenome]|uniref:Uncharacterized protein n=1 Tax=marine sediment metagenome TaxID=412755 RepID=A0A0F9SJ81_9ZZZZ